jgi:amino acid transporter
MMTGLGSIIGSGWLFGAWRAAGIAGPAAIFSWIIGMVVILFIALSYAELGSMFPESGGMVRYAQYTHGTFVGFIAAWANWIAIVSVIPTEAIASIQYMHSWPWHWTDSLMKGNELTLFGIGLVIILLLIYFFLNYWSVQLFSKANNLITIFKIIIPLLTIIGLLTAGFHPGNFHLKSQGFTPNGWSGVFTAVAISGIVFSFNGFQSPINMAGEAKNPRRSIPIAIIGSLVIAVIIYVLLQIIFIGAIDPALAAKGWGNIQFSSPFANLAISLGINWLAIILYLDAFVSPSGTGTTYTATTARMIYGMQTNGYFPKIFGRIHPFYGVPRPAMFFNLVVSLIFLFLFRGWGALAEIISVATIISYICGPISVMALRKLGVKLYRPLKIKGLSIIAPLGFIFATYILYWARWPLTGEVMFIMLIGVPLYIYYQVKNKWAGFARDFKAGAWIIVYLIVMVLFSYLGSEKFGGINVFKYGWDFIILTFLSIIFYIWGVKSAGESEYLEEAKEVNMQAYGRNEANE